MNRRINLIIMLGAVVMLGALIGIVYAAGAQQTGDTVYVGPGIICDTQLQARTISDDMRDPSPNVSDETNALLDIGACIMRPHLAAIVLSAIRAGPYPIRFVKNLNGTVEAFLITDD